MAVGDIYCIKMFQTYLSQNALNVWFYEQVTTGVLDEAEALFKAFDTDVLLHWIDTVTNQVDLIRLEVFNPAAPADFFDGAPVHNQGTRVAPAGQRSPSYAAFGFRSNRAGPGTRASFKRFTGLMEPDIDANSLQPAFTGLLAISNLITVMAQVSEESGVDASFKPVQVKHPVPLFVPVVKNFEIINWSVPFLTSQVSRKAPAGT